MDPGEAVTLAKRLDKQIKPVKAVGVVLCPPFVDLVPVAEAIKGSELKLGAQNAHYEDEGAFTGEIAPTMLRGLADYVIVGHSERRIHAHEDDKLIASKVAAVLRNGLRPILCVGDTLLEREHGLATKVVIDQLTADLSQVSEADLGEVIMAYEPVWAIGTGNFAKPSQVSPMVASIRHTIEELYGEGNGQAVKLLYGGSVIPDNAKAYLELEGVDGLLVGHDSLNYQQFGGIVATAQAVVTID